MALILGFALFAIICVLVVVGAIWMTSNNGSLPAPANYDNRWPGYPLRPSDEGYDPLYKGACSGLPALRYDATTPKGTPLWRPIQAES